MKQTLVLKFKFNRQGQSSLFYNPKNSFIIDLLLKRFSLRQLLLQGCRASQLYNLVKDSWMIKFVAFVIENFFLSKLNKIQSVCLFCAIKLFTAVIFTILLKARLFAFVRLFHPSLILLLNKARGQPTQITNMPQHSA